MLYLTELSGLPRGRPRRQGCLDLGLEARQVFGPLLCLLASAQRCGRGTDESTVAAVTALQQCSAQVETHALVVCELRSIATGWRQQVLHVSPPLILHACILPTQWVRVAQLQNA